MPRLLVKVASMKLSNMTTIRTLLSAAWLGLAASTLVSGVLEISLDSWQVTWLAVSLGASLLAVANALFLFFQMQPLRGAATIASVVFLLYWLYLFAVAPPTEVNQHSLTGSGVILLAVATIAVVMSASPRRSER